MEITDMKLKYGKYKRLLDINISLYHICFLLTLNLRLFLSLISVIGFKQERKFANVRVFAS